jgi:hypothetical protein
MPREAPVTMATLPRRGRVVRVFDCEDMVVVMYMYFEWFVGWSQKQFCDYFNNFDEAKVELQSTT